MNYKKVISEMKCNSFLQAKNKSIPIINIDGIRIGKLIPIGNWILSERDKIELICNWRQKAMRMFLTQFNSTYERTFDYLQRFSISQEGRIFFLIYDNSEKLIGHIGIADVDGENGELDNLVRGESGGDPRLIYYAEIALLNWCFMKLGISQSTVRVLSYNWLVLSLHEEVGYSIINKKTLKKYVKDNVIHHEEVEKKDSNVKYTITQKKLSKSIFYKKTYWENNI